MPAVEVCPMLLEMLSFCHVTWWRHSCWRKIVACPSLAIVDAEVVFWSLAGIEYGGQPKSI